MKDCKVYRGLGLYLRVVTQMANGMEFRTTQKAIVVIKKTFPLCNLPG